MLNEKEKQLLANWLDKASDVYGNHVCNDVEESVWDGWTKEERYQFVKEYHEWNGDDDENNTEFLHLPDFAIMKFLAYKLRINNT